MRERELHKGILAEGGRCLQVSGGTNARFIPKYRQKLVALVTLIFFSLSLISIESRTLLLCLFDLSASVPLFFSFSAFSIIFAFILPFLPLLSFLQFILFPFSLQRFFLFFNLSPIVPFNIYVCVESYCTPNPWPPWHGIA